MMATEKACTGADHRDLFIDALRVVAVLVVVLGHWATTTVVWDADRIGISNALSDIPAVRPLTWLVQVMPLLFFAGGFSNAAVRERSAASYPSYLRARLARLMMPTAVFFAVWLVIGLILEAAGPTRPNAVVRAAEVAALPLWFLGIYVVVVGLAPLMLALHRRRPAAVLVALGVGSVIVDLVRLGLDVSWIGVLNYAFVWLFAHQLGFWYRDGSLRAGAVPWAMAAAGIVGLVVLTLVGGYPVSMVGVPGQPRWNTDPPSLPLIALTLWLVGLALIARPALVRWLGRGRARLLGGLNRRVLSMYLWHVTALAVGAGALHRLGFPRSEVGSAQWWSWRPVWIMAMVPALVVLVTVLGRFELHPGAVAAPTSTPLRRVAAGYAVFSFAAGILVLSVTGFTDLVGEGMGLLVFDANPLLGTVHLLLGGVLAGVALAGRSGSGPVAAVSGGLFVAAGWLELAAPGSLDVLGWNAATATLHLVIGVLAVVLVVAATAWSHRSHAEEDRSAPVG